MSQTKTRTRPEAQYVDVDGIMLRVAIQRGPGGGVIGRAHV